MSQSGSQGTRATKPLVLFVDTNVFIQCKDLSELPWNEISKGSDVVILVPRAVQIEIDNLKQDGRSRRMKRARKASSLFRSVIASSPCIAEIREATPRVELTFAPAELSAGDEARRDNDSMTPDNKIAREALSYRGQHGDCDVRLLTGDTNLMLTARHCDLPFVAVEDSWLLPPEPDERDMALSEILRRLKTLEEDFPSIVVEVQKESGETTESISMEIERFPALTAEETEHLVEEVRARNPIAEVAIAPRRQASELSQYQALVSSALDGFGLTKRFVPPTESQAKDYRDSKYPEWIEAVRRKFEEAPRILGLASRRRLVQLILTNSGSRPAENVVVSFRALGGLLLDPPCDDEAAVNDEKNGASLQFSLPPAPAPPKGHYVDMGLGGLGGMLGNPAYRMPDLSGLSNRSARDPHAFYWKPSRPRFPADEWTLECEEFRHKVGSEVFRLPVLVPLEFSREKAAISCRVSASNLPDPVSLTIPIQISYCDMNTFEAVRSRLG
jgi:hypothetical protein